MQHIVLSQRPEGPASESHFRLETKPMPGQSTFFADAKVTDEHQTVLASATGVFRYRKKFTKGPNHG